MKKVRKRGRKKLEGGKKRKFVELASGYNV